MKSLRLTKAEKKRMDNGLSPVNGPSGPDYPYWARLYLGKADLKKLGVKKLMAGERIAIAARAKVVAVSVIDTGKGGEIESVEICMEAMEITPKGDRSEIAKEVWSD